LVRDGAASPPGADVEVRAVDVEVELLLVEDAVVVLVAPAVELVGRAVVDGAAAVPGELVVGALGAPPRAMRRNVPFLTSA
jgi:hypothetical protein